MNVYGLALCLLAGYALGSIPFGLLVAKAGGAPDPRTIGSRNIGATNVLRTGRKDLAAATLFFDAIKGALAVGVGTQLADGGAYVAAFGAIVGHLFPVWLRFKGGKGVATFLGCLIAFDWQIAVLFALVWLSVAWWTRFSSLAALVAATVTPLALFVAGEFEAALLYVVLAALLVWRHRENIERLRAGVETMIGAKQ